MRLANIYFGLLAFRVRVYNFVARVSIICLAEHYVTCSYHDERIHNSYTSHSNSITESPTFNHMHGILSLDPDGEPSCSNSCHCWDCNSCAIHHQFCSMEKVCHYIYFIVSSF